MQPIGRLTLNANPTNFFAETEQVAFHVGHLVPGIDVTDDPLLQARLFSYVDTQLTRLGGPNFNQIPINRPHAPVNDMLRDGFHQHAVHGGVAPYKPNSLDGGCPFFAGADDASVRRHPGPGRRGDQGAGQPGVVRRPLQPGAPVLAEHDPGREGAHRPGLHLRARQVLRAGDQGAPAPRAGQHRPGPVPGGGDRARPAGARRRRSSSRTSTRARRSRRSAASTRRTAAWSASSSTPTATSPASAPCARPSTPPAWCRCSSRRTAARSTGCRSSGPSPPAGPWSTTCCWWPARRCPLRTRCPSRDEKAGADETAAVDPRVLLMLEECYRHAKVIGAWGDGVRALDAAGLHRAPPAWSPVTTRPPSSPRSRR